jgi:hypothetical protein
LGLLATLLVAVLLAKARYTRQAANADRRLAAVAAADKLLSTWYQNPVALPRTGAGIIPGDAGFAWRTQVVSNPEINKLTADVVRLEILDNRRESVADSVLTSVEFVIEPHPENAVLDTSATRNSEQGNHRRRRSAGTDKSGAAPGTAGNRK